MITTLPLLPLTKPEEPLLTRNDREFNKTNACYMNITTTSPPTLMLLSKS